MTEIQQSQHIINTISKEPYFVQLIQCHNEEGLIQYTMGSIYDEVDKIVVIEGAVKNRPNQTPDGHSTDGTVDKIKEFIETRDPDNKVVFVQKNRPFVDLEELKNTFLFYVKEDDWLIINDVDEFYRPEDIRRLRELTYIYPHVREFVPLFLHFYRDGRHILKPNEENQPQHQRIIKYPRSGHYRTHPVMTMENNDCTYFGPNYVQNCRMIMNDMYIWHYGFVKPEEEIKLKAEFYRKELEKHGDRGAEAHDEKTVVFLTKTEDLNDIALFDEEHPPGIQGHPILEIAEETYQDYRFDHWKSIEPYCLDTVPQCWVLAKQRKWSNWGFNARQ